jgi:hypothetical protein|tara:strand:- start:1288 stop:1560 length:273 start_codon:yes stop_codon:yes gene_type:complete
MAIKATIGTPRTVVGSVSQGNQPQVTRVTVPGPKGDSGATGGRLTELSDVDATSVLDGAMIQYSSAFEKFVITNQIETDTGTLRLNGGTF